MKNLIMKSKILLVLGFCVVLMSACKKDDDAVAKKLVQSFNVALNTSNALPSVTGRDDSGNISMELYDDNSLDFTITADNLASSDELKAAHIHTGDVVSTGGIVITLVDGTDIKFSGNTASGTLSLSAAEVSTLKGSGVYVNVHSKEVGSGLLRGQIDQVIDAAYNVSLSPANAVPAITGRNETGAAYFRLVGSTMYYKVVVSDLDASDAIVAGHIHEGAAGANGGIVVSLAMTDNAQLAITKSVELSSELLNKVKNDQVYVNIHSSQVGSGLLRGQIR